MSTKALTPFLLVVLAPSSIAAAAQAPSPGTTVIQGEATCRTCQITMREIARIGGDADALDNIITSAVRDRAGRYLVAIRGQPTPLIYDSVGHSFGIIGRRGKGPGEYISAELLFRGPGDTIYVMDRDQFRMQVLSPSLEPVRTYPILPSAWSMHVTGDGRILLNANSTTRTRIGYPFHELDPVGNIVRSFGADSGASWGPRDESAFTFAEAGNRRFWTASQIGKYELRLWGRTDSLLRIVERRVDWFRPYKSVWMATPDRQASPWLVTFWEDGQGRIWTVTRVGDRDWKRGLGPGKRGEGGHMVYEVLSQRQVYDTMIEVLDPVSGRVIASQRFDDRFGFSISPGVISLAVRNEDGTYQLRVLRLSLIPS